MGKESDPLDARQIRPAIARTDVHDNKYFIVSFYAHTITHPEYRHELKEGFTVEDRGAAAAVCSFRVGVPQIHLALHGHRDTSFRCSQPHS